MSDLTSYTLEVVNKSGSAQDFYFFSQPPSVSAGVPVFSNSLGHRGIGNGLSTRLVYTLQYGYWIYQGQPVHIGASFSASGAKIAALGSSCDYTFADQLKFETMDLGQPAPNGTAGALDAHLNNFNSTGSYIKENPCVLGISVQVGSEQVPLATMDVSSHPGSVVSMTPIVSLYAAAGSHTTGEVVDWRINNKSPGVEVSNAASYPDRRARITLNADGTWSAPEAY